MRLINWGAVRWCLYHRVYARLFPFRYMVREKLADLDQRIKYAQSGGIDLGMKVQVIEHHQNAIVRSLDQLADAVDGEVDRVPIAEPEPDPNESDEEFNQRFRTAVRRGPFPLPEKRYTAADEPEFTQKKIIDAIEENEDGNGDD